MRKRYAVAALAVGYLIGRNEEKVMSKSLYDLVKEVQQKLDDLMLPEEGSVDPIKGARELAEWRKGRVENPMTGEELEAERERIRKGTVIA
jgi:precorrin-6B methylase 1